MVKIKVVEGDITKVKVDAIINAANTTLMGAVVSMVPSTGQPGRPSTLLVKGSGAAQPVKPALLVALIYQLATLSTRRDRFGAVANTVRTSCWQTLTAIAWS